MIRILRKKCQEVKLLCRELLLLAVSEGSESPIPEAWRRGGTKAERRKKRYEAQFNPYMFAFLAERLRKDRI